MTADLYRVPDPDFGCQEAFLKARKELEDAVAHEDRVLRLIADLIMCQALFDAELGAAQNQ